jgi:hypothetical protein
VAFFSGILLRKTYYTGYLYDKLWFGLSQRTGVLIPPSHYHTAHGYSFFVEGVSLWNSLPSEIRSSRSMEAFKGFTFLTFQLGVRYPKNVCASFNYIRNIYDIFHIYSIYMKPKHCLLQIL